MWRRRPLEAQGFRETGANLESDQVRFSDSNSFLVARPPVEERVEVVTLVPSISRDVERDAQQLGTSGALGSLFANAERELGTSRTSGATWFVRIGRCLPMDSEPQFVKGD